MRTFTVQELLDKSVKQLIDIIITQQREIASLEPVKEFASAFYSRIKKANEAEEEMRNSSASLMDDGAVWREVADTIEHSNETGNKVKSNRGRKPHTPEQKAAAYEEYKRKKREAYWAQKKATEEQSQEQEQNKGEE